MRLVTGALLAAIAAAQASVTPSNPPSSTQSPTARPIVNTMGTLFTQTSWTIQRTGTVQANSVVYFSFTQPATPQSFIVTVSTIGSASILSGSINNIGFINGTIFTNQYNLVGGAGTGTARSFTVYTNDPTITTTGGQTWYIRVQSFTSAALDYNVTVQTVAAPAPAPSPGSLIDLVYGDAGMVSVPQLPLNSYVYYKFNVPSNQLTTSSGFRIELQPSASTDADLFFSRAAPAGSVFTQELSSEAGAGTLDSVIVTPVDTYWIPSGGPYYIKVKAFTACAYTLKVVALAPSPSPLPYIPTPQPSPNAAAEITSGAPLQHTVLPQPANGSQVCYRFRSSASSGEFAATARMQDNQPVIVSVHWAFPPSDTNRVVNAAPTPLPLATPVPGVPAAITARVLRSSPNFLGYAGEYFVCVQSHPTMTAPFATYRLSVADLDPSTASPSPRALTQITLAPSTPVTGQVEWGGYRFYRFTAPTAGTVSFRVIPTVSATTGGSLQRFVDVQPADGGDWWITRPIGAGGANIVDGHLTLTNGASQRGYAWKSDRDRLVWPNFAITYDFTVIRPSAYENGEGFCFILQNDPRGMNAMGNFGDGMGIGSGGGVDGPNRIVKSLSICVKTYMGYTGAPFPNTVTSKFATFMSRDGNMTCARQPASQSGCAFPLPDLSIGGNAYSMSVRITRAGGATSVDANVAWSIVDSYTGVAVGSWQRFVPNFVGLLDLTAHSNTATIGFAGGTSQYQYSSHIISNFFWGARDQLWNGFSGGNADLYVGTTAPVQADAYSAFDTQSINTGVDVVRIDTTDLFYRGAGGVYYVAVYCAGPSGCSYTLEGNVGSPYGSMTPTPIGLPSASVTVKPSVAPSARLMDVNTTIGAYAMLPPDSATYFVLRNVDPGYLGPITVYVDGPLVNPSVSPVPRPSIFAGAVLPLALTVSRSKPSCTNDIFANVPKTSCTYNRDLPAAAGANWVTLTFGSAVVPYPINGGEPVYVEVINMAPSILGASGNATYRIRVEKNAGPTGAPADSGVTSIVIAVVVAAVVIAAVVVGGLVVIKRMKHRSRGAQVVTVMTTAKPAEEATAESKTPWYPGSGAGGSGGGAGGSSGFAAASPISGGGASGVSMRTLGGMPPPPAPVATVNPYASAVAPGMPPPPPPPVRSAYGPSGAY